MRKWTTPTILVYLEGIDLTKGNYYYEVYLRQGEKLVVKNSADDGIEAYSTDPNKKCAFIVPLTQEETGKFEANKCVKIQVSWIDQFGKRLSSDIVDLPMKDLLKTGVMNYVGE